MEFPSRFLLGAGMRTRCEEILVLAPPREMRSTRRKDGRKREKREKKEDVGGAESRNASGISAIKLP